MFSLVLLSGAVAAQTAVETPRTIRVVMDGAYAPYSFRLGEGNAQGILADQWQAWQKKTGIRVDIQAMDWNQALRRMRAGEFDVIDSIVETPERQAYFDFTPAYTTVEASIYFRNDISGIADLASLKGFPVGVKAGDQHIDRLKENGVTTVILFQSNEEIVEAAKQNKINVFVMDDPSAVYLLNKSGIEADFQHSAPVFHDELRRAVRKGDTALLRTVTAGFSAIEPRELAQIDEKWFGRTIYSYRRYFTYASYAAAVAVLLIVGLTGWNRTLRKGILQRTAALRQSEERFAAFMDNLPGYAWMKDLQGRYVYVNHLVSRLPGYQALGKTDAQIWPADLAAEHRANDQQVIAAKKPIHTVEHYLHEGKQRHMMGSKFPIFDKTGAVALVGGAGVDITERIEAEEALRESEQLLQLVLATLPVGVGVTDRMGDMILVNAASKRIWGDVIVSGVERREQSKGFWHDSGKRIAPAEWASARAASEGQTSLDELIDIETFDGHRKTIQNSSAPIRNAAGLIVGTVVVNEDVTERVRAESALRESTDRLQHLSRRLLAVQEDERNELARELHDRVGQNLTVLNINLKIMRTILPSLANDELRTRLADSEKLVESTTAAIRNVMSELHPPMLDDHGLAPALDWYARQFSARTGISVAVRGLESTERAAAEVEIALFRIAQEALINVVKHARASKVEIALDRSGSEYVMSVQDDGVGFNAAEQRGPRHEGLGIVTMRERSQAVGGRFEVQTLPGSGTRLTVRVPI